MKNIDEMDFTEFRRWAEEHVIDNFLQRGLTGVRESLYTVLVGALHNEVWGGDKNPIGDIQAKKRKK